MGELSIVGNDRSAFKRIDKFRRVKAEHLRSSEVTDLYTIMYDRECVARIEP